MHAAPSAAAANPTEGYFTHTNSSAPVLGAYPRPSDASGGAFPHFAAASPGPTFAPPPATGLGLEYLEAYLEAYKYTNFGLK
jgi:hypothetical protein